MVDYNAILDQAQQQSDVPPAAPASDYSGMLDKAQAQTDGQFGITDTWPFRLARAIGPDVGQAALAGAKGLYAGAKDAFNLPGDVVAGKQDLNDPSTIDRAMNFATMVMPVNPAFGSGERAIAGVVDAGKGSPTREALLRASKNQYSDFINSGIKIRPEAMDFYRQYTGNDILSAGITPETAPQTYGLIGRLAKAPPGSFMSPANFKALREGLGNVAGSYDPAHTGDAAAATIAIKRLDQLFNQLPQEGFVAGTTPGQIEDARAAYANANGNFAAAMRSGTVSGKVGDAELRAIAANSGRNIGNTIRQRMAGLVTGNNNLIARSGGKATRGFTPDELAGVTGVVEGNPLINSARYGANLLGGGGGLGHTVGMMAGGLLGHFLGGGLEAAGAGAAAGAPALGVLGAGLKSAENAMVRSKAAALDEAIRARSPLAQSGATGPATSAAIRAAIPRMLAIYLQQNPDSL